MTARPWMPLYIADYRADTAHLGAAEHGAYLLLIMHYWQTGGLPTEDSQLARISCMTPPEWKRARSVVSAFFDDGWKHGRIEAELERAIEVATSNSAKASGAAQKRWGKHHSKHSTKNAPSIDQALPQNAHSPSHSQKEEKEQPTFEQTNSHCAVAEATRTERVKFFEDFWKVFPRRKGSNPKHPAQTKFLRAIAGSPTAAATIILAAGRYCKEMRDLGKFDTEMVAQAVTWLDEKRWLDYAVAPSEQPAGIAIQQATHPKQWQAWRRYRLLTNQSVAFMDSVGNSDTSTFSVPTEWPPDIPAKEQAA